jgi:hypothetical protein
MQKKAKFLNYLCSKNESCTPLSGDGNCNYNRKQKELLKNLKTSRGFQEGKKGPGKPNCRG